MDQRIDAAAAQVNGKANSVVSFIKTYLPTAAVVGLITLYYIQLSHAI